MGFIVCAHSNGRFGGHLVRAGQGLSGDDTNMIDLNSMTVLIVDDMVSMCRSIHSMLKMIQFGRHVYYAHNGREALTVLQQEPVDLMLLDYNMPVMNGGELLSIVRDDRELRYLPVVMITAQALGEYVAEAAESTIDAYILKPLTIKVLEEKVQQVVALANNPPAMIQYLMRAKKYEDDGNLPAAITQVEAALAAAPDSPRPVREMGYYHFKLDDLGTAEKWFLKAAEMNDLDVFAFHHLGEIYLRNQDFENAQRYLEKAMQISPRHLNRGIHFAETLVRMGIHDRAQEVFNSVIRLAENALEIREKIAAFCLEAKLYRYTVKLLTSIITGTPDRQDINLKLGLAYQGLGETGEALAYFTKAQRHEPDNDTIPMLMAKIYLELGKPIFAERLLNPLLRADPDHPRAKALMRRCIEMEM